MCESSSVSESGCVRADELHCTDRSHSALTEVDVMALGELQVSAL